MSSAYYDIESLRFWSEEELELRDMITNKVTGTVKRTLSDMNSAWKFYRVEGPILTPQNYISSSYDEDDIWYMDRVINIRNSLY